MSGDNTLPFNVLKIEQLAKKYKLKPSQVKDMYLFTEDDYDLLDKACKCLARGETRAEVARKLVLDKL